MKKLLHNSWVFLILGLGLLLNSCSGFSEADDYGFTESQLVGTWKCETLFEKYNIDKTGSTWDTSDDVSEDEAQKFTWTLDANNLVQIHLIEAGGEIPKSYTIDELNATEFVYSDEYGKTKSFSKVSVE